MARTETQTITVSKTYGKELLFEAYGAILTLFSLALILSLVTFSSDDIGAKIASSPSTHNLLGPVGAHMAYLFLYLVGIMSFAVASLFGTIGVLALFRRPPKITILRVVSTVLALLFWTSFLQIIAPKARPFDVRAGGQIGMFCGEVMIALFSRTGAGLVASGGAIIATSQVFGFSLARVLRFLISLLFRLMKRLLSPLGARLASFLRKKQQQTESTPQVEQQSALEKTKPAIKVSKLERPHVVGPSYAEEVEPYWVPKEQEEPLMTEDAQSKPQIKDEGSEDVPQNEKRVSLLDHVPEELQVPKVATKVKVKAAVQERLPMKLLQKSYEKPPLSLLDMVEQKTSQISNDVLRKNAETLERKLLDYRVEGRVVEIHPGPVVTMYEFLPAAGVKISQISALDDDLTMALEAMSIRIVAPIPGKGVVGIEVPNEVRETVYLREILASEAFQKSKSKLTLALGKDIFGNPVVADLAKMPHLLIAGATGSGKSVAINAFLLSLCYNATPEEVRIILVDPKVVELQIYDGIPHLLLPVVYDPKHAAAALRWAVEEMERRYELLARFGTRNIQSYNQRVERILRGEEEMTEEDDIPEDFLDEDGMPKKLPYCVVVMDEFADLMMVASKEVETAVARLAQKARAAGIHLIMATQRPSKEVITGLIKANFTCRISFRVSSKIDSRIILDQAGAEALLGYGDMLFLKPGSSVLQRVHGPFVSEAEVERVVKFLKSQGEPDYRLDILNTQTEDEEISDEELDPLYDDALAIVKEERRASISYLQRRLKVGYNRAARIMEQMEKKGVVGPPDSRGERQVLL